MSLETRWKGVFCFLEGFEVGEGERFRLVVVMVSVVVAVKAGSGAAEDEELEEERLVSAVEGFWADVARRVSLLSLGVCGVIGVGFEVIFVGFGGLEKSISSESLLEELVSEPEEGDAAFLAAEAVAGAVGFGSDSLSSADDDDEASEDEDAACFCAAAFIEAVAVFGASAVDSLSEDEVSEDDGEAAFDGSAVAFDFDFLEIARFLSLGESGSESEAELEEEPGLAFRFRFFTAAFTDLLCKVAGVGNLVPLGSCSSSASLSELELDVDGDGFACGSFFALAVNLEGEVESFISTSESLPLLLSLSPLILVLSSKGLSAAASSRALALAFDRFFDFLAALVSELSLLSLLLVVSSMTCLSWYTLYHSLKILTRSGKPLGSLTSSFVFHSSSFLRDCS